MSDRKNVTLTLPEPLLKEFRVLAAKRNESMTALMVDAIRSMLDQQDDLEAKQRRLIESLQNPPGRGTGTVTWTRDQLHER